MKFKIALFLVLILLNGMSHSVELQASFTKTSYYCSDKIEILLNFTELDNREYGITVLWVNPHGETQDSSNYTIRPNAGGGNTSKAWLSLHRGAGASIFAGFNSSVGFDEFIGSWKANVLLDDRDFTSLEFDVIC